MGCEGCHISKKGQDEELLTIRSKAKKYASEKNIPVAICREGYEYFIYEAGEAIRQNYLIVEVLSQYN
jgi:hypothetical protein